MAVQGMLTRLVVVAGAALVGTYVGEFIRSPRQAPDTASMGLVRASYQGSSVVGVRVNLTNLIPALIIAWLAGPPRPVAAFLGGVLTGALLGDTLEPKGER